MSSRHSLNIWTFSPRTCWWTFTLFHSSPEKPQALRCVWGTKGEKSPPGSSSSAENKPRWSLNKRPKWGVEAEAVFDPALCIRYGVKANLGGTVDGMTCFHGAQPSSPFEPACVKEWLFSGNVFAWKNLWRDAGGKEIFWVEGENEFLFRPSHQRWSSVTSLEYWIMIIISRSGSSKVVQSVVRGGGSRFLQPLKVLLAGGHGQSRLSKDKLSAFYSACFDTKSRKVQRQTFERCQWHLKSHSMLTLCWFQGKATFTLCVDVQ